MSSLGKIGIGVITCNRQDFFEQCIESIPRVDYIVVVNDGKKYPDSAYPDKVDKVIQHPRNFNVAKSKNDALRDMLAHDCQHMFLCEDDIVVTNSDVCMKYIEAAAASGIYHLNYGGHGDGNRNADGSTKIRNSIDYDGVQVDFYEHCLGAWSYYLDAVVRETGLMDERFVNAMEHVEHTYRIIKEGLHPPFWWFADAGNSHQMICDIKANHEGSTIRQNQLTWEHNLRNAYALFMHKHGVTPTTIPHSDEQVVLHDLDNLETNYKNPEWISINN